MTDQQDYRSIDELFKRTFDDLPDTPSSTGWDLPSGKVWEHVQGRIQTPKSGWSSQALTLVSAFAVVLTVGMYLFFGSGEQKQNAPEPAKTEQRSGNTGTAMSPDPVTSTTAETSESPVAPRSETGVASTPQQRLPNKNRVANSPVNSSKNNPAQRDAVELPKTQTAKPQHTESVNHTAEPGHHIGAMPLPGSKPSSPNSTVAKRHSAWQTPLKSLPIGNGKQNVPTSPESLRVKPYQH